METGNAQYLSSIEEGCDLEKVKENAPEPAKVSGSEAYLFLP